MSYIKCQTGVRCMNQEKHNLLEDILADAKRDPLFFKEALEHSGINNRNLMQLYMMYKFKYMLGKELQRDPGWDYACEEWVNRNYAAKFADVYDGRLSVRTTTERLFEE